MANPRRSPRKRQRANQPLPSDSAKCGSRRKPREGDEPGAAYYCELRAGFGTDHVGFGHCKYHAGGTPSGKKAAATERLEEAVIVFGLPREIEPHQALLEEVQRTAGHVAWLESVVGELDKQSLKQYTKDKGMIWEKPAVWVEMLWHERAHLVRAASEAIKCGVAEAQVRLAESQGELLVTAIRGILQALGVDDRKPEVAEVVSSHLRLVSSQVA